jgi:hypothetical protein
MEFTLLDLLTLIFRHCSHDLRSSTMFSNLNLLSSSISITLVLYSSGRSMMSTAIMSLSPMREGVACCDLCILMVLIQLMRVWILFTNALIDWPLVHFLCTIDVSIVCCSLSLMAGNVMLICQPFSSDPGPGLSCHLLQCVLPSWTLKSALCLQANNKVFLHFHSFHLVCCPSPGTHGWPIHMQSG